MLNVSIEHGEQLSIEQFHLKREIIALRRAQGVPSLIKRTSRSSRM